MNLLKGVKKVNSISPSCFYFPTTALLVDDDLAFLENMRPLINNGLGIKITENPEVLFGEVQKSFKETDEGLKNPFLRGISEDIEESDGVGYSVVNIDIEKIHHVIYNKNRFSRISTIIVDYKMPKLNGIELCRRLQKYPIKKILLTGKADNKTAVSAFNEGIIDKFIQKSASTMIAEVDDAVKNEKLDFFKAFSEPLLSTLSAEGNCILNEQNFWSLFSNILHSKNIIEYYLIDKFGSYLMLDENANYYFLMVRTEKEINQFYDIAIGNHASSPVTDVLRNRTKMPVFLTEEEHVLPTSQWYNYLYEVQKLEGRQNYYYSVIENIKTNYIDKNKIISYKNSGVFA